MYKDISTKYQCEVTCNPSHAASIILDVERYHEFVPLCCGVNILEDNIYDNSEREFSALMKIDFCYIKKEFTSHTKYKINGESHSIITTMRDGPDLRSDWIIVPDLNGGSKINYELNLLCKMTTFVILNPIIQHISSNIKDAFIKRMECV